MTIPVKAGEGACGPMSWQISSLVDARVSSEPPVRAGRLNTCVAGAAPSSVKRGTGVTPSTEGIEPEGEAGWVTLLDKSASVGI